MPRRLGRVPVGRGFRRLWAAQAISLVGDWFTIIALSVVISRRSHGSGLAVSALILTQLVPIALIGPFGGVLADRFDRRRLLVLSDVARVGVVLLLIPAVRMESLGPAYALALLHFTLSSVFVPARTALVPRLVTADELIAAATLSSVTWSVMTAAGGILGGTLLSVVGVSAAFGVDALTFLASAALIASIDLPPAPDAARADVADSPGFIDGLRYVRAHPATGAALLVKSIAGIALVDTFLVLYATRVFALGEGGAVSLGRLWACFGLGAILGPSLLGAFNDGSLRRMRRLILVGCGWISAGLLVLGLAPSLAVAGLGIVLRGMGGSSNWTYSTVILQTIVPDRLRGRLFALDLALLHLTAALCSLAWGVAIDHAGVRPVVVFVAALTLLPLVAWALLLPRLERDGPA